MDEQLDYSDISSEQLDADTSQSNIIPQYDDIDEQTKHHEKFKLYNDYLTRINPIIEALNQTASKYSKDSGEYNNLIETCNHLTNSYQMIIGNNGVAPDIFNLDKFNKETYEKFLNDVDRLNNAADAYILHCNKKPKSGSRRKTRYTLASILSNMCNALICKKSLETYLQDNIVEEYYSKIVTNNISKMKAAGLSKDDIKSYKKTFEKERNNSINQIKDNSSFKEIMAAADLACLIEWKENPEIAFKAINSAIQKSATNKLKAQANKRAAKKSSTSQINR